MSQRSQRVGDLIRTELSELFRREVRDPRVGLATVTRVEVSSDFGHADVHVSVLGSESERAGALEGLTSARGFLRRELARRLSLRTTPELKFHLDRGAEHSQRIEELLAQARREDDEPGS